MMTRTRVFGVAAAGLLLLGGLACHGARHKPSPERLAKMITYHVNDVLDELEPTDSQRTQVLALKDRVLAEMQGLRQGAMEHHEVFLAELARDTPDRGRLETMLAERLERHRELAGKALDVALELHGILTPAQRAKLLERVGEHLAD